MTATLQASGLVALAERIELWQIDSLRPYERNPRTHSEAQVDQIAASMVEFGWTNVRDLGEEHLHPRPGRLPAPVRTDLVRLEGWERPLLVWGAGSRRRMVHRQ